MGAWGIGPFENDSALDWLGEAVEVENVPAAIEAALRATFDTPSLDVDEGSAAVAAAAILASTRDQNVADLPEDAASMTTGWTPEPALVDLAFQALSNVTGSQSELASLAGEGGDGAWAERIEALKKRLQVPARAQSSRRASGRKAGALRNESVPKRRKRRIEGKQGDIFEVPLDDGRRGYGQVLGSTTYGFFAIASRNRLPVAEVASSPVAFRMPCITYAVAHGEWPLIGNVPLSQAMGAPFRLFRNNGHPDFWFLYEWTMESGGDERRVAQDEVKGLEAHELWAPQSVVQRLTMHLRGEPCPLVRIA